MNGKPLDLSIAVLIFLLWAILLLTRKRQGTAMDKENTLSIYLTLLFGSVAVLGVLIQILDWAHITPESFEPYLPYIFVVALVMGGLAIFFGTLSFIIRKPIQKSTDIKGAILQYIDPEHEISSDSDYISYNPKYVTNNRLGKTYPVPTDFITKYVRTSMIKSYRRFDNEKQFDTWLQCQGFALPLLREPRLEDLDVFSRADGSIFYLENNLNDQTIQKFSELKAKGLLPKYVIAQIHFCRDLLSPSLKIHHTPTSRRLLLNYDTGIAKPSPAGDLWLWHYKIVESKEYNKHFPFELLRLWCFLQKVLEKRFKYDPTPIEISELLYDENLRKK